MVRLLFVCMGNICRSPAAEAIMNQLVKSEKLQELVLSDSCGTTAHHVGQKSDARMRAHAKDRGIAIDHIARHFNPKSDFDKFDYILAMDKKNYSDLLMLDPEKKFSKKIHMMTDFSQNIQIDYVPDPYYGGDDGFERVLDLLEDSCHGLLDHLLKKHQELKSNE